MCEAVVEGMGSKWDKAASPVRHLGLEAAAEECVVAWNAPPACAQAVIECEMIDDAQCTHNLMVQCSCARMQGIRPRCHSLTTQSTTCDMVGKDRNGQQKPWNFTHHDHHHSERSLGRSLVVDRHKKDKPRLPDHIYNVAA